MDTMKEFEIKQEEELSNEWKCQLFGDGETGIIFTPKKGEEPNWFWRKMQYLFFGCKWIKNG